MKRGLLACLALIVCSGQICAPVDSGYPVPGYITRDDVTNLPAGNATTSDYNGRLYKFMSRSTNSCECTPESVNYLNPCSAFAIVDDEDLHYEVIQDGASIMFRGLTPDSTTGSLVELPASDLMGAAIAPGAMDQDGTFVIGSIGKVWDTTTGANLGEQFLLIHGSFVGDYMFLQSTQHATARKGDLMNDCQFELSVSFARTAWPESPKPLSIVASGPSSAQGGETVNLVSLVENASGTTSFSWVQTAIGTSGTVSLIGSTSQTAVAVFSADASGTFSFEVTVQDSAGRTASDTISVTVQHPADGGAGKPPPVDTITLAAPASDGYVVLSDWSVWSIYSNEYAATDWLVGDNVTVDENDYGGAEVTNERTSETVGASYVGVGTQVTLTGRQTDQYGDTTISFSDGTSWDVASSDENVVRTWATGDDLVVFEQYVSDYAINLRTGRAVMLFSPW